MSSAPSPTPSSGPSLNRAQREAVGTLSGPVLVLAGAGTGKTRVITYRIAALIQSGVQPSRILAVTFTNKAAREMRERALALLGKRPRGTKPPEISTFHSLCVRVLRRHAPLLGYPSEFAIYDRGDQESLARTALRDVRVGHEKLRPGDLLALIGGWKNKGLSPASAETAAEKDKEQLAALCYARYQQGMKASGAMDFDDLLLKTEELFAKHPEARFAEASRFDHVLVDEYQDTNDLQYRILKCFADRHRNLCVVGDDDQSIYGWRGAEIAHILGFQRDWAEAKVIRLEENYRSVEPILKLANTLIAHNDSRHPKTLRATREGGFDPRVLRFEDEVAEAEGIVREIGQRLRPSEPGAPRVVPSDIAVLFRTNEQPRAFELELRRAGIQYKLVGGLSFYDRREVKDALSYLRILANPKDEVSLLRAINLPPRGIGAGSIETLMKLAVERGAPLWAVLPEATTNGDLPHGVGDRIEAFRRMIEGFRARVGQEPLFKLMTDVLTTIDYKSEVSRLHREASDAEARWNAVEAFVNSIALYEQRNEDSSLVGFLEQTTLSGRDDDDDDDKKPHAITLQTLHSAKGLEFPHVYLIGMEEGILPHARSIVDGRGIDEERRLAYVGVTRAQTYLTMSFAKGRMKWGKMRPSIPSRFLMEMKGDTERARRAAAAAEALFKGGAEAGEDDGDKKGKKAGGKKAAGKKPDGAGTSRAKPSSSAPKPSSSAPKPSSGAPKPSSGAPKPAGTNAEPAPLPGHSSRARSSASSRASS
ncbi:MAG TPA: UvrD-helicase domain-containing protein [Polyangiaceae bacterium]|nr:UvrD-helicase domain-containing protein [Polyangiaceae bacterium]